MSKSFKSRADDVLLNAFNISYVEYDNLSQEDRDKLLMGLHSSWVDLDSTTRIHGVRVKNRLTSTQGRENIDKKINGICKQKIRKRK